MFKYNFDAFAYSYHAEGCVVFPDDAAQNVRLLLIINHISGNTTELFVGGQSDNLKLKKASVKCGNKGEADRVAAALNSIATDATTVPQHIWVTTQVVDLLENNFPDEHLAIVRSIATDFIKRPRGRAN